MTLTSQQQELAPKSPWTGYPHDVTENNNNIDANDISETNARRLLKAGYLGDSFGPASQLLGSVKEPVSKYLTLATSLTSQLGGGLKSRANGPTPMEGADLNGAVTKCSTDEELGGIKLGAAVGETGDELGPLSPPVQPQQQPVLTPAAVAAQSSKGRPLNRLAMNRAKFAIRSYTIAVSFILIMVLRV